MNHPYEPDGFLSQQKAAEYSGLSVTSLMRLRRRGELIGYRVSGDTSQRVLYRVTDLDPYRTLEPVPLPPTANQRS